MTGYKNLITDMGVPIRDSGNVFGNIVAHDVTVGVYDGKSGKVRGWLL